MSIRVCGGKFRSRRLECPAKGVRPTTDRVKEAIFSTISHHIHKAAALDLFAGSGSLGIETLSRGAKQVTFVDKSVSSIKTLKKNLEVLGVQDALVVKADVMAFIRQCNQEFDLIFMDPPYNKGLASKTAPHVYKLLKIGGILIIEHSPDETVGIEPWKTRTYGDTKVTYIMRGES